MKMNWFSVSFVCSLLITSVSLSLHSFVARSLSNCKHLNTNFIISSWLHVKSSVTASLLRTAELKLCTYYQTSRRGQEISFTFRNINQALESISSSSLSTERLGEEESCLSSRSSDQNERKSSETQIKLSGFELWLLSHFNSIIKTL
ncbi:hypothetical protein NL108_009545 [Boleophthalmus pectinirostris]|nr:hypothetical protein NL108_009545 [Boleophthalmus pectinirostris]